MFEPLYKPGTQVRQAQPTAHFFAPPIVSDRLSKEEVANPKKGDSLSGYYGSAESLRDLAKEMADCRKVKLSQTTIKPESTVDTNTPAVLDQVMTRAAFCGRLSIYLDLKGFNTATGHFIIHQHQKRNDYLPNPGTQGSAGSNFDSDDWHRAVDKYLRATESDFGGKSLGERRTQIMHVGGFYDRKGGAINMPSDGTFGSALHERIHMLSRSLIKGVYGQFLNEGVTQYFTDIILRDEGLSAASGHQYGSNLALAKRLVSKIGGLDLLAQAYFQGSVDAHKQILVKLGFYKTVNDQVRHITVAEILTAIRR